MGTIVETLHIILAILGLLIRWLLHLKRAQDRAKERVKKAPEGAMEKFSWRIYVSENYVLMCISLFSTAALLFLTPMCLELFGYVELWGNLIAFMGGLLNLEIVYALKYRVLDKIKYTRTKRS